MILDGHLLERFFNPFRIRVFLDTKYVVVVVFRFFCFFLWLATEATTTTAEATTTEATSAEEVIAEASKALLLLSLSLFFGIHRKKDEVDGKEELFHSNNTCY